VTSTADSDLYAQAVGGLLDDGSETGTFVGRLLDAGWAEFAAEDTESAVRVLFEEQGCRAAASRALDLVVAQAGGLPLEPDLAVVHPFPGKPAAQPNPDGTVVLDGLLLAGIPAAVRIVAWSEDLIVSGPLAGLEMTPISGLDPTLGISRIQGSLSPDSAVPSDRRVILTAARRALAHELLGLAAAMLTITVRQVGERRLFQRRLAEFQTVKHRLAEVRVSIDGARSALDLAWASNDALTADVAKALCGKAALLSAKHSQQLCGAIGFTVEHPLPRLVRRANVMDALYGSAAAIEEELGGRLLNERAIPRLPTPW
jgi:hypothetical protein